MNRGRNTRGSALKNAAFVSGGVLTDFTGTTAAAALPDQQLPSANIAVKIEETTTVRNGNNKDITPEVEQIMDNINPNNTVDDADTDGASLKKKWIRKPLNKKAKRLRQNRRLRKLLIPKNALMSLHELMGNSISEYRVMPEERGFVAQVLVNNIQYEGRGTSKIAAKNNASEKALRDLVIQKMVQVPKTAMNLNTALSAEDAGDGDDIEMAEEVETKDETTAEVPMMHLASFALHKLFSEWQAEGFEIPDFKTGGPAIITDTLDAETVPVAPPPPVIKTTVPENANSMHPTTLLCMMRPGTKYVDLGAEGKSPVIVHSVGVEIDGRQFIGRAKNKKLARKLAARDACNTLFGTQYPLEDCESNIQPQPQEQPQPQAQPQPQPQPIVE